MAKTKKEITVDDLAMMIQKEFSELREANKQFATEFSKLHEMDRLFVDEFDRVRSDIRDIKTTLGPLVRIIAQQEREMMDLQLRLNRVERKVGIKTD